MKKLLRAVAERRLPTILNFIRAVRNRRRFRKQFGQLQRDVRCALYNSQAPITVQTGPFKGMKYLDEIVWGSITPKWLGSYESELQSVIDSISRHNYSRIIDVGCAEGYYAVGLAKICEKTSVFAYDTDYLSRRQAKKLAKLNNVEDRVRVGNFCDHSDLDAISNDNTLVVCDIEGFET